MNIDPAAAPRQRRALVAVLPALVLALSACGGGATSSATQAGAGANTGSREISVEMVDFKFKPATVNISAGETIHFVFQNDGALKHEAVIGDAFAQQEQEDQEAKASGGPSLDEPGEVEVDSGATGTLDYTFAEPGTYLMGCHVPGHYAAGMVATVVVN